MNTQPVTDEEYRTHVQPTAHENWATEHGNRWAETDAEWDEAETWAVALRAMYDTGECEITWRNG
jgi:hypothetical protein